MAEIPRAVDPSCSNSPPNPTPSFPDSTDHADRRVHADLRHRSHRRTRPDHQPPDGCRRARIRRTPPRRRGGPCGHSRPRIRRQRVGRPGDQHRHQPYPGSDGCRCLEAGRGRPPRGDDRHVPALGVRRHLDLRADAAVEDPRSRRVLHHRGHRFGEGRAAEGAADHPRVDHVPGDDARHHAARAAGDRAQGR